jgi:hypothetical protein
MSILLDIIKWGVARTIPLKALGILVILLIPGGILVAIWWMGQPFKRRRWRRRTPSRDASESS